MRFLLAALALVALPACIETSDIANAEISEASVSVYTPPRPHRSRVMILKDVAVTQPTEILGLVDVSEQLYDHDRALESLKAKAETLGADAVVGLEYHHSSGKHDPSRLSGTAIRFKDLVHGRAYEPIGTIGVDYEPGAEEDGLRLLKAKARGIHADLILDLKYERGAGSEVSHVSGTAIRFVPTSPEGARAAK